MLTSRHEAGALVGYSLTRMHIMGIVCGVAILSFRLLRMRNLASLIAPAGLCVAAMILLTVISQAAVSPKLALLRGQMGSIEKTAAGKALLEEFGRLHAISVGLETAVLLAGLAALFWMVQDSVRGH